MTEPNMELEGVSEKILAVLAARFDRSFSVDDYIELVDKAISEAEIHGFCNAQNGYAEVVKKLSDDVEKAEQRGYEKGFSDGHLNGWNEAIEKSAAEERGRIAEQLKESGVTCPEAYGFEGRETYCDGISHP